MSNPYKSEMSDKGLLCLIAHYQLVSGFTNTKGEIFCDFANFVW